MEAAITTDDQVDNQTNSNEANRSVVSIGEIIAANEDHSRDEENYNHL